MRLLMPCLLVAIAANCASSARILAVLPTPAKSHQYVNQATLKALAARGHQIVSYSPFYLDKPVPNYTEIHIESKMADGGGGQMSLEIFKSFIDASPVGGAKVIWGFADIILGQTFEDENIKKLIDSNEKFDLIVLEMLFSQEAVVAFGHRFKAPVVNVHTFGSFGPVNSVSGNPLSLAYIPDYSFPYSDRMSLYERFLNAYSVLSSLHYYYSTYLPRQEAIARSAFKDPSMPPLVDMLLNTSLTVTNINPYAHYSHPNSPNVVPVGGIHLSSERKPLPEAMKKFLDDAKQGVIYLSLGSVVPENILPQEFFDNFINAFRRLPYRVLWKTERSMTQLPEKIFTSKWIPQQDVLAHQNIVLFITHGGLLSQHEAINAGVPVICIPFLGDQPMNAKFYEAREVGVRLNFNDLSEETIYTALTTVLNTTKYKDNMARLSRIYRDQPTSPADRLVFWVEYVLRHGGAHHLRPASALLPWYQLYLIDILALLLATASVSILFTYFIIRKIYRLIFVRQMFDAFSSSKKKN
ncbi:UDP-glycosyltransferase UGT5-like [Homalodisca vitripennis]|uniref:UDP-glycosyltransferase UGT5-like n=1 Tax=Homalodisca vitripennis TaxID=197043 RepID=UPI001EEC046A|nr:UDP-glycosyltransferase UGT5-like [Homalodisca vitripennis]